MTSASSTAHAPAPDLATPAPPSGAAPADAPVAARGPERTRRRAGRWVVLGLLVALVAAALPMAVRMLRAAPPDVGTVKTTSGGRYRVLLAPPSDVGTVKTTSNGRYRVLLAPEAASVPLQQLHRWTVRVEPATAGAGASGSALTVTIDGRMPQHGHGLPTQPRVTGRLPDGRFVVDGMKFSMPGWWELRVYVAGPAGADSVTYNLTL